MGGAEDRLFNLSVRLDEPEPEQAEQPEQSGGAEPQAVPAEAATNGHPQVVAKGLAAPSTARDLTYTRA